jgi:ATP cone domain
LSDPSKQGVGRKVSIGTSPSATGPVRINVLKFNGTVQPFDRNKLVNSISKAGATPQQATLVSNRVVNRLSGFKQPVPSSQLSSMVARSLGQVNPSASSQYTGFRDQKLARTLTAASSAIPAVIRVGPASTTAPMQVLLGLLKKQISIVPSQQLAADTEGGSTDQSGGTPPAPGLTPTELLAGVFQPDGSPLPKQYGSCIDTIIPGPKGPGDYAQPVCLSATLIRKGGTVNVGMGIQVPEVLEKTGMVAYKWYYFSPTGTWPEENQSLEAMENGRCDTLFAFNRIGVYEFTVIWLGGDGTTVPSTSNKVTIRVGAFGGGAAIGSISI